MIKKKFNNYKFYKIYSFTIINIKFCMLMIFLFKFYYFKIYIPHAETFNCRHK